MQLKEIQALLEAFETSSAVSFVWEQGEEKISFKKAAAYCQAVPAVMPSAVPTVMAAPPTESAATPEPTPMDSINAPLVGTFYAASAPDKAPFVAVGDKVKQGQTVCLLEAMKMMSEVPAPFDCVIEEVLIADGTLAEFGCPLFRITRL